MMFSSTALKTGIMMENWSQDQIKNEPMLFSCNLETAFDLGGPITHDFLDKIPQDWKNREDFIIDTRVHMLMKNWFPAIPGFHHDDVPRSTTTGQPNYKNPEYKSEHVMTLVNGDICPTEFALGFALMPEVPEGEIVYKVWHKEVVKQIDNGTLVSFQCPDRELIYFDWESFHQGTRAIGNGWRWFSRCSINTQRKHYNELRRQVQVYLSDPMEGW